MEKLKIKIDITEKESVVLRRALMLMYFKVKQSNDIEKFLILESLGNKVGINLKDNFIFLRDLTNLTCK